MPTWKLKEVDLPLKFDWKISRGASSTKKNFIVETGNKELKAIGEVAFNTRYGESEEATRLKFDDFLFKRPTQVNTVEELSDILNAIDAPNSLRFGIESAFIHYLAEMTNNSVSQILGMNTVTSIDTSFSIPILETHEIEEFYEKWNLQRFKSIKLKINGEDDVDKVKKVLELSEGRLRVDANEGFKDHKSLLDFYQKIGDFSRVDFIEQPFKAEQYKDYELVKDKGPVPIIADESITNGDVNQFMADHFDGVNIKLMKSGGYFKAVKQLQDAREMGMKTMVGCMVETSLGINSAMNIASGCDWVDLDGCLLLEKDPYNYLMEEKGRLMLAHLQ